MEQTKTNTPPSPQWGDDFNKWYNEDPEHRSVICITTDENDAYATLLGYSFPIVMALLANGVKDKEFLNISQHTHAAATNPLIMKALLDKWQDFKKEHGYPISEEEAKSKPSIESSLKDLFQALADKL